MSKNVKNLLKQFQTEHNATTKGPLALLVQLTRMVRTRKFPLKPDDFLTENKGQVAGLGGGNLKKILKEFGIVQTLASEGGRTSRGNMGLMIKYIEFLNTLNIKETINFDIIEQFWAEQVQGYFRNQPFTLSSDTSQTIAASLDELFEQARKRQKQNPGTQYLGMVLQHLIAAKLSLILPQDRLHIYGVSVADSSTERSGDFVISNTVIHCTTAPNEQLIKKCKANIRGGCLPIIITIFDRVKNAYDLAIDAGISGRIEVWDIQQFLSSNINEHGLFDEQRRTTKLADIIERYNQIIDNNETDPSLKIEFDAK